MQANAVHGFDRKKIMVGAVSLGLIFVVLLFSVIMLFASAFGWFVNNRVIDADGAEVTVSHEDARAEYECYVYNIKTSSVETQSISDLNMQPYDMIFDKRNRYTPAIIRISLDEINPMYSEGGTLSVTISRDITMPNNVLNEYFSSIMRITAVVGSGYYSANADTLYGNIDSALYTTVKGYAQNYSSDSSKTFTTITGGTGAEGDPFTYSKADAITLTVPYTSTDKNSDTLNLYLYLTYDETLVHRYRAMEGIDTSSSAVGKTVTMTNDTNGLKIAFS